MLSCLTTRAANRCVERARWMWGKGGKPALGSFGKRTKMKVGREVREIHMPPFNNLRHFTFLSLVPHKI